MTFEEFLFEEINILKLKDKSFKKSLQTVFIIIMILLLLVKCQVIGEGISIIFIQIHSDSTGGLSHQNFREIHGDKGFDRGQETITQTFKCRVRILIHQGQIILDCGI